MSGTDLRPFSQGTASRAYNAHTMQQLSFVRARILASWVIAAVLGTAFGPDALAQSSAAITTTAPGPSAAPLSARGLKDLLTAQRGKVVLLNLWGTWCVPCLREIPDLVALESELAPRGMVLLGVAMDESNTIQSTVEPFRLKYFPRFRTWVRSDPDMDTLVSVVDPAWNEILPTSYVIGRDGKVVKKIQGKKSREEFRALLEAAL